MKFNENKRSHNYYKKIVQRVHKKYLGKIFVALILSVIVAGSTSAIAWLLDPAVKKIFIDQDRTYAAFYSNFSNSGFCW